LSIFTSSLLASLVAMPAANAAPPENDALRRAITIEQVPFSTRQSTEEATASGPRFCGNNSSVFYQLTPTEDVTLDADTFGSDYDTVLTVFTGTRGAFEQVTCNDDAIGLQSAVRFEARAGITYYFMISGCCGFGQDGLGGHLAFGVTEPPAENLEVTLAVDHTASLRPGSIVLVRASMTCNARVVVELFGELRQLRDDGFVAHGGVLGQDLCTPGRPGTLRAWVDTVTGAAFEQGPAALVRAGYVGSNGFEFTIGDLERQTLRIARL
jgi:hypothetical protein